MKILMFSMDRALLGQKTSTGDTIKRHQLYGSFCEEINIVVFCKQGYEKQQLSDNVFVWPVNFKYRWQYFFKAYKIATQIHLDRGVDLVIGDFFTGVPAYFLKKKFGLKFLLHLHGDFYNNIKGLESKWYNLVLLGINKFLIRQADAVRVVSLGIAKKLISYGISKDKVFVIPTPFDLAKFLTYDQTEVYRIRQQYVGQNILFVGRLEKVKNLSWFLEVFKIINQQNRQINFLIVGDGLQIEKLQAKTKALNLSEKVFFIGQVDYNYLTNYFHSSDVFVLPSVSESFGKVLIEAGASGVPVVSTKTTGGKEIVLDGQTGFLVGRSAKKIFAEKILTILSDQKLADKMSKRAIQYVKENFDGDANVEKIIRLWERLVGIQ